MIVNKKKRLSLTIRWQPTEGKPMAEITRWLSSLSIKERREKVAEACLMVLLPYAFEANGKDSRRIERCFWDSQNRLDHYSYAMKQALGINSRSSATDILGEKIFRDGKSSSQTVELEAQTEPEEQNEELDDDLDFSLSLGVLS